MRCLSVRQPWAWAIASGMKRIENRGWPTRHRGDLLIHAGLSRQEFRPGADFGALIPALPPVGELPFGAIVAVVRVVDCVPYEEVAGRPFAEPGGWCWILEDPRPVVPVPWVGRLGLFEVPGDVVTGRAVENRVRAAVEEMRAQIAGRVVSGTDADAAIDALHGQLDMSPAEFSRFQDAKNRAVVDGTLTEVEAASVDQLLGDTAGHFNRQDVAVKIVLTRLYADLIGVRSSTPRPS